MSLTHIETIELTASQSSITFSSIPQDYDDLYLVFSLRTNHTDFDVVDLILNGSTSNFSSMGLQGTGSSANSGPRTDPRITIDQGGGTTANTFGNTQVYISNYTASKAKSISIDGVAENNATFAIQTIRAMLWNDTSAITSLGLDQEAGTDFVSGSTFSLYGITAGGDGTVTTA